MIIAQEWDRANSRIDLGLGVISLGHLGPEGKGVDSTGVGRKSTVCVTSYVHIQLNI